MNSLFVSILVLSLCSTLASTYNYRDSSWKYSAKTYGRFAAYPPKEASVASVPRSESTLKKARSIWARLYTRPSVRFSSWWDIAEKNKQNKW